MCRFNCFRKNNLLWGKAFRRVKSKCCISFLINQKSFSNSKHKVFPEEQKNLSFEQTFCQIFGLYLLRNGHFIYSFLTANFARSCRQSYDYKTSLNEKLNESKSCPPDVTVLVTILSNNCFLAIDCFKRIQKSCKRIALKVTQNCINIKKHLCCL